VTTLIHLAASSFFSMSETAMISLGRTFLKKAAIAQSGALRTVHDILDNPRLFFGTVLIGNNIAIVGFSAFGVKLYQNMNQVLGFKLIGGLVTVTIILDVVMLTFGEILPKQVGLAHSRSISLRIAPLLFLFSRVLRIPIAIVTWPARVLLKSGISEVLGHRIDDRAIRTAVSMGSEQETLGPTESEWISNVLALDDKQVSAIMTPAVNIAAVSHTSTLREALNLAAEKGLSRLPVYRDDVDHITGVLMVKELLGLNNGDLDMNVLSFQHPVVKIPETKCVFTLLKQMQARRRHMAIVVNEYGETAGIVTIEDIVEELFGEIYDEHDVLGPGINQTPEGLWLIDGLTDREIVEETLGLNLKKFDDLETIGGIIAHLHGELPVSGTRIEAMGYNFTVLKMIDNRVHLLEAEPVDEEESEDLTTEESPPEAVNPS
jgi:CBS domain containing-hemolysin-like protein